MMKEVLVGADASGTLNTTLVDSPVPSPGSNQVVIRNVVVGTNPKDFKFPLMWARSKKNAGKPSKAQNTGDDVAGYVHGVGEGVTEFHVGDRVAAFHEMGAAHGAFAEYTVAHAHTTFHLPPRTSFEEAATIPLAAMTAAVALFARLGLPEPWAKVHPARSLVASGGVLVYGAASAVGAYAIKLLSAADLHPIIAVAGRGITFVEGLLDKSKGDVVLDYREGGEKVAAGTRAAVPKGGKLLYAFDAVCAGDSISNIVRVLDLQHGSLTTVAPMHKHPEIPKTVSLTFTTVGSVHGTPDHLENLGFVWFRAFGEGLRQGWFSGHPFEVVPGGLRGVGQGLSNLKEGRASAVKYVYRIEDTKDGTRSRL